MPRFKSSTDEIIISFTLFLNAASTAGRRSSVELPTLASKVTSLPAQPENSSNDLVPCETPSKLSTRF